MKTSNALFLLIFNFSYINGARILGVFPTPSISHQVVFRPIIQELVKRGHEAVVVTPDPAFPAGGAPANLTEIDLHDVSYAAWENIIHRTNDAGNNWVDKKMFLLKAIEQIFEVQMTSQVVQENVLNQNEKFDVILVEACVRMTLGLSNYFKAPIIQISSVGSIVRNYEILGSPYHPFLYPHSLRYRVYNLNVWEKLDELYYEIRNYHGLQSRETDENEGLKRIFGKDTPPLQELYKKVDMLLVSVHSIWENNRPVPPNVIFLGALHQNPRRDLPKDLKQYLDSSKNGVIYVSFGTNVRPSLLPLEKIKVLTDVFSELPYDIIFKWDQDELPGRTKNVKITKWIPQADMLRHPKIKLFITQGGLQSTDEAITAGVPLLGIPMLADQWYNVENYVKLKIGRGLSIDTLNKENFAAAINTIIKDESYRRNVKDLHEVMKDQPMKPLEQAVWCIEHVLRHGGARHLKSAGAEVSWSEYIVLDVILMLFVLTVATLILAAFICKTVMDYLNYTSNIKLKKQN